MQLLGVQDATTYEQNAVVKGHTGLCQSVGLAGRYQVHEDEGLFVNGAEARQFRRAPPFVTPSSPPR